MNPMVALLSRIALGIPVQSSDAIALGKVDQKGVLDPRACSFPGADKDKPVVMADDHSKYSGRARERRE